MNKIEVTLDPKLLEKASEILPEGCKRIWYAVVLCEVKRFKNKKYHKEKYATSEVYKDGEEKNKNSYFYKRIERQINLKEKEEFKVTDIDKIRYLGFSIPENKK